jgi:hypothetical protein
MHIADNVKLPNAKVKEGASKFEDWHWGVEPAQVIDWEDNDYPSMLIECGRLIRMHIRTPDTSSNRGNPSAHPRRKRDTMIELSRNVSENSHIAYDPDHADERLYLLIDPKASQTLARRFWHENEMPPMPLSQLAMVAGGRHGKRPDYPSVMVKPVGILTAVVYKTWKKGDENPGDNRSFYIHQLGEMTHFYPVLAADQRGRMWLAGGNYKTPTAGISD